MPISKQPSTDNNLPTYPTAKHINLDDYPVDYIHSKSYSYLLAVLCFFVALCLWVMQNSVNAYYLQTYHKDSPLLYLNKFDAWKKGGEIGNQLYAWHGQLTDNIANKNQQVVDYFNENFAYTPQYLAKQQLIQSNQAPKAQDQASSIQASTTDAYILRTGDEIFFAGDSMMQGVAPHVQQYLQKNYNIKSVNLSKQSTGLAYPSLFNWPKTIEETLANNANIKILAVFLGPNDPWDMPDLTNGGQLKFQTPQWEAGYQARMASILNTAKNYGVKVIWITPPNMKKAKLNEQMIYLTAVMKTELQRHDVKVLDARELLGTSNDVYNDYLVKDGKSIKMRSSDGIHFSVQGQKLIAQALQDELTIITD